MNKIELSGCNDPFWHNNYNRIKNIDPLKDLLKLTELNLSSNNIVNIRPIRKLHKLKVLDLSYNKIRDKGIINKYNFPDLKNVNLEKQIIKKNKKKKRKNHISLDDLINITKNNKKNFFTI